MAKFMKPVRAILIMALLTAIPPAHAMADGPDYYVVTGVEADDVLNMRSEDHFRSDKVGEIPHDATGLKNLGCNTDDISMGVWLDMSAEEREDLARKRWCKVEYNGMTGWVAGRYLKEDTKMRDF